MIKERIPAIEKLSKKEKILLAGELWDEAFTEEDVELTEDQKKELDKRIKYAEKYPDEMISWEQVRDEIRENYGR